MSGDQGILDIDPREDRWNADAHFSNSLFMANRKGHPVVILGAKILGQSQLKQSARLMPYHRAKAPHNFWEKRAVNQGPIICDWMLMMALVLTSYVLDELAGFGQALGLHCGTSSYRYLLH